MYSFIVSTIEIPSNIIYYSLFNHIYVLYQTNLFKSNRILVKIIIFGNLHMANNETITRRIKPLYALLFVVIIKKESASPPYMVGM
jgi:hypothetical protein